MATKKLARTDKMDSKYKNPDNNPRGTWRNIIASVPDSVAHQGMVYAIQNPFTDEMAYPPQGRHWTLGQEQILNAMNQWAEYELRDLSDVEERARVCGVSTNEVRKDVLAIVLKKSLKSSSEKAKQIMKGVLPEFYFSKNGTGTLSRKAYIKETVKSKIFPISSVFIFNKSVVISPIFRLYLVVKILFLWIRK